MDKFSFIQLWDTYRGLLTPTQGEITDMYFNLDLTPSEIAAEKGITRQGVSECLKTCKAQLEEYEEKLGFCAALNELALNLSFMAKDACDWAESFKKALPEFAAEIGGLICILNKDYTKESKSALTDADRTGNMRGAVENSTGKLI